MEPPSERRRPLGGAEFGPATNGNAVYVGIADIYMRQAARPGLSAIRLSDGNLRWTEKSSQLDGRWTNEFCDPAISMAVTAIPGVVFAGAMNGRLSAYDAADGHVIWQANTGTFPVRTLSGEQELGGVLDASGPVVAGGMLYLHSGYANRSGLGGTVLRAYSVDGR